MLEVLGVVVLLLDLHLDVLHANAALLSLFRLPVPAIAGRQCHLSDPDGWPVSGGSRPTCAPALQQLFVLTPSEANICQALARGHTIGDIASHCGVTASTVKPHLPHVSGKTDTRRQGDWWR